MRPTANVANRTRQNTWRDRRRASRRLSGRPMRAPPRIATPMISDSTPIATTARNDTNKASTVQPPIPAGGSLNRSTPGASSVMAGERHRQDAEQADVQRGVPERDPRLGDEVERARQHRSDLRPDGRCHGRGRQVGGRGGYDERRGLGERGGPIGSRRHPGRARSVHQRPSPGSASGHAQERLEPIERDVAPRPDDADALARLDRDPAGEDRSERGTAGRLEDLLHPLGRRTARRPGSSDRRAGRCRRDSADTSPASTRRRTGLRARRRRSAAGSTRPRRARGRATPRSTRWARRRRPGRSAGAP